MPDSFFQPVDPAAGAWEATTACAGPWSERTQHGGPPSALLVAQAEQQAAATRADLVSQRVALDFVGPIPVGPVTISSRVVRSGRSVVLVDGELGVGGRTCLRARTWLVRSEVPEPTPVVPGDQRPPPAPDGLPGLGAWGFPYADHMEWRSVSGGGRYEPGPAQVWVRPRVPLVPADVASPGLPGLPALTGLQRAVLAGDSGSGLSAELDWDAWAFLNIDLDVHLLRQPEGEWLMLDSRTRLGAAGTGLATTTFHDQAGVVGTGNQTLIVSPR